MNSSAVTTVGHWNFLALAARCSQDWKILRCPLLLMFDLIRSAARLFLIGSAGAVLGLAGFILVRNITWNFRFTVIYFVGTFAEHPCVH